MPLDISLTIKHNLKKVNSISYIIVNTEMFLKRLATLKKVYGFDFDYKKRVDTSLIDLYEFNIENKHLTNPKISTGKFYLMINKKLGFVSAFTDSNKIFLNKSITKFLYQSFYPFVNKITPTSQELYEILDNLENQYKIKIYSTKSSGKRLFGDPETLLAFKKGNQVPFRKIFNDAYGRQAWVNWLTITTEKEDNYSFKGDISRDGAVGFIRYESSTLNVFLDGLYKIGVRKTKQFDRKEMTQKSAHPFILEYKDNIFDERENVEKLKVLLSRLADFSFSIIHGGNPHLYIYLQDDKTKASYSIRTVGGNRIILTPQFTSDTTSFSKLINYLTDNFSEYDNIKELDYNG